MMSAMDRLKIETTAFSGYYSFEWKREKVFGKRDTANMEFLRERGWRIATGKEFPGICGRRTGPIRSNGLVLMYRNKTLTDDAYEEERAIAESLYLSIGGGELKTDEERKEFFFPDKPPSLDSNDRTIGWIRGTAEDAANLDRTLNECFSAIDALKAADAV